VSLPVSHPLKPMLAKRIDALPSKGDWIFEPKWDGFRTLVFRDGDELFIQSRDLKPLNRYFPELEAPLRAQLPDRCVVDGEIVIAGASGLDFGALQMRIHPAESRVNKLAAEIPASVVLWDLLCLDDEDLQQRPFEDRRTLLADQLSDAAPPVYLTPATRDRAVAADWFKRFEGAGFDGVMAKQPDGSYQPNKRSMFKVKHKRTVDCVVAGYRWHKNSDKSADGGGDLVGSLLLGLNDDEGVLHHVGVAASFRDQRRRELVGELASYREDVVDHPWASWAEAEHGGQRKPGATSRWSSGKQLNWVALRPELVVEVSYDNMMARRFRHTAHFVRWRSDKPPAACTYEQVEVVPPVELAEIFSS
jgi:ATP-dependent DNA ligase